MQEMLENDSNNDVFACIQNLTIQMLVIQMKIWMIHKILAKSVD